MKIIKIIVWVLVLGVVYSITPMIPFLFMKGAELSDNNSYNVDKLNSNEGEYFSFIVFGDNHAGLLFNDSSTLKEVWHMNREDRFKKAPIDFVLSTGDISLDGKESHFKAWKKIQKLIKYPVVAAVGNHDTPSLFEKYQGVREFSFVNRNSYFIVLDNAEGQLTDSQFNWLRDELEGAKDYDNIFIALHKPPFDPYQEEWYNMDNQPWAYRFRKLCAEYKVNLVFSGHKHMFKSETFDGVENIVTGGGGMLIEIPEDNGGYLHYTRVMVNNDYVTYEVRKVSPPFWEYICYYLPKEMVYWARNFYGSGHIFTMSQKIMPLRETRVNNPKFWMWKD